MRLCNVLQSTLCDHIHPSPTRKPFCKVLIANVSGKINDQVNCLMEIYRFTIAIKICSIVVCTQALVPWSQRAPSLKGINFLCKRDYKFSTKPTIQSYLTFTMLYAKKDMKNRGIFHSLNTPKRVTINIVQTPQHVAFVYEMSTLASPQHTSNETQCFLF